MLLDRLRRVEPAGVARACRRGPAGRPCPRQRGRPGARPGRRRAGPPSRRVPRRGRRSTGRRRGRRSGRPRRPGTRRRPARGAAARSRGRPPGSSNVIVSRWAAGPIAALSACSGVVPSGTGASGRPPSTSTVPATRSACRWTNAVATKPPIECPVSSGRVQAEVVEPRRAGRRRAGPCRPARQGAERPRPRRSGATTVHRSRSASTFHARWLAVTPCAARTTGAAGSLGGPPPHPQGAARHGHVEGLVVGSSASSQSSHHDGAQHGDPGGDGDRPPGRRALVGPGRRGRRHGGGPGRPGRTAARARLRFLLHEARRRERARASTVRCSRAVPAV